VFVEQADCVNEICADDRISTNTNASRLADFSPRELAHRFISQRSASRNDADISLKMNMAWHDSDFALTWRNDSATIGAEEAGLLTLQISAGADHVECRNSLGNTNHQFNARSRSFHNRVCRERRGNEDHGRIGACLSASFFDGVEYIKSL